MTPLRTQPITTSVAFILLLNQLELKTHYKYELLPETETKQYLLCNWIILHANQWYSSAVPSISYDPAEHKMIFFIYGIGPIGLVSQIKIWISSVYKRQFMSANLEIFHQEFLIMANK